MGKAGPPKAPVRDSECQSKQQLEFRPLVRSFTAEGTQTGERLAESTVQPRKIQVSSPPGQRWLHKYVTSLHQPAPSRRRCPY